VNEAAFKSSFDKPQAGNPYLTTTIDWLNSIRTDLWDHLESVSQLTPTDRTKILTHFVELACQCQNMGNIQIGRYGLAALPRDCVLQDIESVAEPMLNIGDAWEWRRLLEVYSFLDNRLTRKLAERAVASDDQEIRIAGSEFLE
jgi:hypothetical protein